MERLGTFGEQIRICGVRKIEFAPYGSDEEIVRLKSVAFRGIQNIADYDLFAVAVVLEYLTDTHIRDAVFMVHFDDQILRLVVLPYDLVGQCLNHHQM